MAAITSLATGVGLSAYQMLQGQKDKKRAQNELNNYDRVDLTNNYENIPISTAGTDLATENNSRVSADMINSARMMGTRGAFGIIPQVQAFNNANNQETRAYLDNQINNRAYAVAGDNTRIQGMKNEIDNNNINALSSQIQAGKQDMWSGMLGFGKSIMYGARNIDFTGKGSWNDQKIGVGGKYGADYVNSLNY